MFKKPFKQIIVLFILMYLSYIFTFLAKTTRHTFNSEFFNPITLSYKPTTVFRVIVYFLHQLNVKSIKFFTSTTI